MNYIKLTVTLHPFNQDASDLLMANLGEQGFESFMENEHGFEAYIEETQYSEAIPDNLETPISGISIHHTVEVIEKKNWNEEWEKHYFQPIVVADQCVVRSPFHHEYPKVLIEIVIEPKMSFGTGHHATTCMMMEYILEHDMNDKIVLDMGCGTGILGILASIKGAKKVTAIDIDDWCTENCTENNQINNIHNMDVLTGDASQLPKSEVFDVILANINRNILLSDIPAYSQCLKKGGLLLLSGFYTEDIASIDAIAKKHQLKIKSSKENNNWASVAYEK
ncbi:50S ribosomal protein L11 methyltransferase [Natronoflexus pectinivorans]|uniref:Ribosomal protein L11 methyltransferase n=1 Tax=Natronoflexus pectinivorans TaxID=682526 RepID=A0A4R2GD35_9BACT|nr:50S ribosomal protein L11 methyltransferase [Natronoflexus pectinivorans]TCO05985.1 ribosomal protein L11 methyltransferase [Natronoflexus pectinivorans]